MNKKVTLSDYDTYVFIDASNIRASCLLTLRLKIDFIRLAQYFQEKYPHLKKILYYEGIASGDSKKKKEFQTLEKSGHTIKTLARKSYINPAQYRKVQCCKCGYS